MRYFEAGTDGFSGGSKPLKPRELSQFESVRKGRSGEIFWKTEYRSPGGRKALKSEAPERWGLKNIPKVRMAKPRRGSRNPSAALTGSQATFSVRLPKRRDEQKGQPFRKCCRARKLKRGAIVVAA
jgi:hypothetical protein